MRPAWATEQEPILKGREDDKKRKREKESWAVVPHTFNPSTQEVEATGFLSLRHTWSTEQVPGQPRLHREALLKTQK